MSVQPEPVALDEVVSAAILAVPDAVGQVRVEVPDDLPLIRADRGLLERVLVNLLDNALRHGASEQPVEVRALCRRGERQAGDRRPRPRRLARAARAAVRAVRPARSTAGVSRGRRGRVHRRRPIAQSARSVDPAHASRFAARGTREPQGADRGTGAGSPRPARTDAPRRPSSSEPHGRADARVASSPDARSSPARSRLRAPAPPCRHKYAERDRPALAVAFRNVSGENLGRKLLPPPGPLA
jgi:hypothetical protein